MSFALSQGSATAMDTILAPGHDPMLHKLEFERYVGGEATITEVTKHGCKVS